MPLVYGGGPYRRARWYIRRVLAVQIAPRVFQVAAPFENDGLVNCYFVDAPRKALIDTGTASVPSKSLLPALKELGWATSELRLIVNAC